MRFKKHLELEYGFRQIEIIPLINLIFLILVFFLIALSFTTQSGIRIGLPKFLAGEGVFDKPIEIILSGQDLIYFDGSVINNQDLKSLIGKAGKKRQPILIKSDRRSSLGRVAEIWDICRDLGVAQVSIAATQQ